MMADLVRLQPDVITAFGTAARVAHAARVAGTAGTIPIVVGTGEDPIASGLVTNLRRPDNNITGATSLALTLAPKRVEFLHELPILHEGLRSATVMADGELIYPTP